LDANERERESGGVRRRAHCPGAVNDRNDAWQCDTAAVTDSIINFKPSAHSSGANNDNNIHTQCVASLRNLLILSWLLHLACGEGLNTMRLLYEFIFMFEPISFALHECNLPLHPGISERGNVQIAFLPFAASDWRRRPHYVEL